MSSDNQRELPDFIQVASLRDIYWNNNSDLYPNRAPQIDGYQTINNTTPIFFSSGKIGTCVLTGDFNHAFYNGQYFFLTKIKPLDLTNNTFEYQLDYDVMMNLLHQGAEIKGTLIRTNRQDILAKVVQTTTSILSNPTKPIVGKFNRRDFDWKVDVEISFAPESFRLENGLEQGISKKAWDTFINRIPIHPFIQTMRTQNWQTTGVKRTQRHTYNPLFIVDSLETMPIPSWKMAVLFKVEEMLSELILNKEKSKLEIRSFAVIKDKFFSNKKVITYNDDKAVGTTVEQNIVLKSIDLSKLYDIEPIDENNVFAITKARKGVVKDLISGDFELEEMEIGWYVDLCRNPHLPLKPEGVNLDTKNQAMPLDWKGHKVQILRNWEDMYYTGNKPQLIEFKKDSGFSSNTGWLWSLPRLDFAIVDGWRTVKDKNDFRYWFNKRSYFDDGQDYGETYYFRNRSISRRNYPALGFLIFQLKQDYELFDEYQYIGNNPSKEFLYRSGLHKLLSSDYGSNTEKWFTDIKPNLAIHLAGCAELSRFILDIDLFRWTFIAPSAKGAGGENPGWTYKWWNEDYYGILKHLATKNSNYQWYPSNFVNFSLSGSGDYYQNPLKNDKDITTYNQRRKRLINSYSLYKKFELEVEVKKNDIFCSNIDYVWKQTPFNLKRLPLNLTDPNIWDPAKLTEKYSEAAGRVILHGAGATYFLKDLASRYSELSDNINKGIKPLGSEEYYTSEKQTALFRRLITQRKDYFSALNRAKNPREIVTSWLKDKKINPVLKSELEGIKDQSSRAIRKFARQQIRGAKLTTKGMNKYNQIKHYAIVTAKGGRFAKTAFTTLKVLRAARALAALKSLGISLAFEGLYYGLGKLYEAYSPDEENRLNNSIMTIGDFFGGKKIDISVLDKRMVVYLHQNKVKVGIYREHTFNHTLSDTQEQAIDKVDGVTAKKVTYYHIQEILTLNHKSKGDMITQADQQRMLEEALFVTKGGIDGKIFNFTFEDLEAENDTPLYFDLKGTDWIVTFTKGRPHLIAKNFTPFSKKSSDKTHTLEFPEGVEPTINEIINQKAQLVCYGQPRLLNTKFDFKSNTWKLTTNTLTPIGKQSEIEYIHIVADNDYDYINDWIQAFKTRKEGVEFDAARFEILKIEAEKSAQQYLQHQQMNELLVHQQKTEISRKFEDMDIQWWKSGANVGLAAAAGALAGGVKGFVKGGLPGAAKGAGLGAFGGALGGAASSFHFWTTDYHKQTGRLEEDEALLMQKNTLALYHRKQNYELDFNRRLIELNSLANTYVRPGVNDTEIQKEYNKLNGWEDINVQVYLPDARQLEKINYIFDVFGCECISNEFEETPLIVENGIDPALYQFAMLSTDGVVSKITRDLDINTAVRNIFENGVYFDEANHFFQQEEEAVIIVPKETPIDFDLDKIKEWSHEVWDTYVLTKPKTEILKTIKGIRNYGLTDEEYNANKARLDAAKGNDEELFKVVNEVSSHRKTGSVYVVPTISQETVEAGIIHDLKAEINKAREALAKAQADKADCEANQEKLNKAKEQVEKINKNLVDEIAKVKRAKEALEASLKEAQEKSATLESEKQKLQNDLNQCLSDKDSKHSTNQDLQAQLAAVNQQLTALNTAKTALEEQHRQCQINLTNLQQAKDTCDRINTAEQKKLKTEIATLKQQIAERTRDRDQAQTNLNTANQNINTIQNNLNTKTEELRQCQINLTNIQKAKETCDRINAEEQKRLKKELDDCKKNKDDEVKRIQTELDTCKSEKGEKGIPNACELLHKFIKEPYPIDIKLRNGTSAAELLLIKLAENLHNVSLSHINEKLAKYPLVNKIFPVLNDLEDVAAIDTYLDAMNLYGWDDYKNWKFKGGEWKTYISEVVNIVNDVQDNLNTVQLRGLKAILDEIAFLSYEAKKEHSKKNKKDPDNEHRDVSDVDLDVSLQYFFTKIVGNYKQEYKNLFNEDLDNAIKKRTFLKKPCVTGGTGIPTLVNIDKTDKETTYSTEEIPDIKHPPGLHFYRIFGFNMFDKPIVARGVSDITYPLVDQEKFNKDILNKYSFSYKTPTSEIWTVTEYKTGYVSQGYKYNWVKVKKWNSHDKKFLDVKPNLGFYMRNSRPTVGYEYAHQIRNQLLNKFHNRLDQENLRQAIKTRGNLKVKINLKYLMAYNHDTSGWTVRLEESTHRFDIVETFGIEDAYYALYILLILAWYNILKCEQEREEPKYPGVYYLAIENGLYGRNVEQAYEFINNTITTYFENNGDLFNYTFYVGLFSLNALIQYISLTVKTKKFSDLNPSFAEGGLRWLYSILPS